LNEIFTPGNYEDDDYSLRIRQNGYKLMLCKDTYIHHFGNISFKQNISKFHNTVRINKYKFEAKWGCDSHRISSIIKDITSIIKQSNRHNLNIIHIGCGGGGTLLDIKNEIPKANLYGIENNSKAVVNTEYFAEIEIGGVEKIQNYPKDFFDYVIITELSQYISVYKQIIMKIKGFLMDEGGLIVTLPKNFNTEGILKLIDYIKEGFGDISYHIIKNNIDILLYIKMNDK